jgi:hypothetical protein
MFLLKEIEEIQEDEGGRSWQSWVRRPVRAVGAGEMVHAHGSE